MKYVDNKLGNALLGMLTFFVTFIIQDLLEYYTVINMDNTLVKLGTFIVIYLIMYFVIKMVTYKYREN